MIVLSSTVPQVVSSDFHSNQSEQHWAIKSSQALWDHLASDSLVPECLRRFDGPMLLKLTEEKLALSALLSWALGQSEVSNRLRVV